MRHGGLDRYGRHQHAASTGIAAADAHYIKVSITVMKSSIAAAEAHFRWSSKHLSRLEAMTARFLAIVTVASAVSEISNARRPPICRHAYNVREGRRYAIGGLEPKSCHFAPHHDARYCKSRPLPPDDELWGSPPILLQH